MKCVLFLAGVVLIQAVGTFAGKEHLQACTKELGISEEMLKEGFEKNHGKPEFRCLGACILKKAGILEPGNHMNLDMLKEVAAKFFGDKADIVVKTKLECAEQSKGIADECDFANSVHKCQMEKLPDLKSMKVA